MPQADVPGFRTADQLIRDAVQIPLQTPLPPRIVSGNADSQKVFDAKLNIAKRRLQNMTSVVLHVSIGTTPASAVNKHYTIPATTAGDDGTSGILDLSDVYGEVHVFSAGVWSVCTLEVPLPNRI